MLGFTNAGHEVHHRLQIRWKRYNVVRFFENGATYPRQLSYNAPAIQQITIKYGQGRQKEHQRVSKTHSHSQPICIINLSTLKLTTDTSLKIPQIQFQILLLKSSMVKLDVLFALLALYTKIFPSHTNVDKH